MTHSPPSPCPWRLRPVAHADLEALLQIAARSADAINSLPEDRARLDRLIGQSVASFASEDVASGEERYLWVLEDLRDGRLAGTSGVLARAGFHDRFYSYRNEFVLHASPELGRQQRMHTLHLCHDLTGYTLLTSFFILPELELTAAPQLLSRARLLFIQRHAERFSDRLAAETPGWVDEAGNSPFWEAVGRRFFGMSFPQVEALSGGRTKSYIADLMPQAPLHVALLPPAARWALGQMHPVGELPLGILLDEGFDADTYVDLFDGGPTAEARLAQLRTVQHSRWVTLSAQDDPVDSDDENWWQLVGHETAQGFEATLVRGPLDGRLPMAGLAHLPGWQLEAGARVQAAPVNVAAGHGKGGRDAE